jgi:hypothetical protein
MHISVPFNWRNVYSVDGLVCQCVVDFDLWLVEETVSVGFQMADSRDGSTVFVLYERLAVQECLWKHSMLN